MNIVLCGNRTGFDTTKNKTNTMCEEISVRKESAMRSAQMISNYQILCNFGICFTYLYLLSKFTIPK